MEKSKDNKAAAEPPLDCNVGQRIERYLRQLAPHQTEREGPTLLREGLTEIERLRALKGLGRCLKRRKNMNLLAALRRIRRCENEVAAQVVFEHAIAQEISAEREKCASVLEMATGELLLMAGEMTAQELRTVKAVLAQRADAIRKRSNAEVTRRPNGRLINE